MQKVNNISRQYFQVIPGYGKEEVFRTSGRIRPKGPIGKFKSNNSFEVADIIGDQDKVMSQVPVNGDFGKFLSLDSWAFNLYNLNKLYL